MIKSGKKVQLQLNLSKLKLQYIANLMYMSLSTPTSDQKSMEVLLCRCQRYLASSSVPAKTLITCQNSHTWKSIITLYLYVQYLVVFVWHHFCLAKCQKNTKNKLFHHNGCCHLQNWMPNETEWYFTANETLVALWCKISFYLTTQSLFTEISMNIVLNVWATNWVNGKAKVNSSYSTSCMLWVFIFLDFQIRHELHDIRQCFE